MNKYKVGDKVIFKYLTLQRLGIIEEVCVIKDLKQNKNVVYSIKDMSPNIAIKERNILHLIEPEKPKPFLRIKVV